MRCRSISVVMVVVVVVVVVVLALLINLKTLVQTGRRLHLLLENNRTVVKHGNNFSNKLIVTSQNQTMYTTNRKTLL